MRISGGSRASKGVVSALRCALALAGHLSKETLGDRPTLDTPDKVADYLREDARPYTVETFVVLVLDCRRKLIKGVRLAQGTLDSILVHSREVFRQAIAVNGAAIILSHNLCAQAHKLCYVTSRVMCSHPLASLAFARVLRRKESCARN